MKKMIDFIKKHPNAFFIIIGLLTIIVYELPFLVFGENSWIRIHDCLDDKVAHMRMVIDSGALFNHNKVLPILYGINRAEYIVDYSFTWIIFSLLPTYWAFIFNDFIVRVLAYIGMYVLLTQYAFDKDNYLQKVLACAISICYSFVSFYTIYGLSAAGIPLVLYAFLNLSHSEHRAISYIIIAVFAMYSNLVLSGLFIGFVLVLYWMYLVIVRKNWVGDYFFGLCLLGGCYLIVNIDIIFTFFCSGDFVSHRVEFGEISMRAALGSIKKLLLQTQYHCGEFPVIIIIFTICLSLLSKYNISKSFTFSLVTLLLVNCLSALGILAKTIDISFFRTFQMDRFYFLLPALWIITFACALKDLSKNNSIWFSFLFVALFAIQIYNHNPELKAQGGVLIGKQMKEPTFKQFYDTDLFDCIANDICNNKKECKVVSIGMHPAVAEYNGFHVLDGYVYNYQLEYKHKFRQIIQAELDKDSELKSYFDNWGSRCYIFYAHQDLKEIGINDNKNISIDINTNKLRELGCQYILSAVTLDNYKELELQYVKNYTSSNSYWDIILYKL